MPSPVHPPARRDREPAGRRDASRQRTDDRLAASTAFGSDGSSSTLSAFRPRLGPLGLAFVATAIWFAANVRSASPLDVLPFAWMWLTLWLALSVALAVWQRVRPAPRRRRRSPDGPGPLGSRLPRRER